MLVNAVGGTRPMTLVDWLEVLALMHREEKTFAEEIPMVEATVRATFAERNHQDRAEMVSAALYLLSRNRKEPARA